MPLYSLVKKYPPVHANRSFGRTFGGRFSIFRMCIFFNLHITNMKNLRKGKHDTMCISEVILVGGDFWVGWSPFLIFSAGIIRNGKNIYFRWCNPPGRMVRITRSLIFHRYESVWKGKKMSGKRRLRSSSSRTTEQREEKAKENQFSTRQALFLVVQSKHRAITLPWRCMTTNTRKKRVNVT